MAEQLPPPPGPPVDTREFFFPGGGLSTLLVHGLTGTPYEMRYLGERLAAGGMRVLGVKLAGHASTPKDLAATTCEDWYRSVATGFDRLCEFDDPIVVVGLSAGAVLAARLTIERDSRVSGLALLAPAFFLAPAGQRMLRYAAWLGPLARHIRLRKSGSDIQDDHARAIHPNLGAMPLSGPISLMRLSARVRPQLGKIVQPVLIIHSRHDHTCPTSNVDLLTAALGSADRRVVMLDNSFHVITVDCDKQRVADEVVTFAERFRRERPARDASPAA